MKYRDHSQRSIPRITRPAARPIPKAAPDPVDEPDDVFISRRAHNNDQEPLININDKESRLQTIKDGFGTLAHAGSHIVTTHLLPRLTSHAKNLSIRTKSLTKHRSLIMPSLKKSFAQLSLKKYRKLLFVATIVFVTALVTTQLNKSPLVPSTQTAQQSAEQPVGGTSPQYPTLLPTGSSIEKLGGWQRVSPPQSNPVFAYVDTIDRIQVTVSQQPLPDTFSDNPDKDVKDLAQSFNANDRHVADDATVYFLGTSSKGPQSAILAKKQTLILIKAPAQIKTESWSKYIASLD